MSGELLQHESYPIIINLEQGVEGAFQQRDTEPARKISWNPAGVEPVHWILAHIETG